MAEIGDFGNPFKEGDGNALQNTWNFVIAPFQHVPNAGQLVDSLSPGDGATPATPSTPEPTLGQTNIVAIQDQLASERQFAAANPNLTGGAGLLDQPTTTSRVLLGS